MADPVATICGAVNHFDTFGEALQCKLKVEDVEKKPFFVLEDNTGGTPVGAGEAFFTIENFEDCKAGAKFDNFNTAHHNRLRAKACSESLTRLENQSYTFQVIPDFWAGVMDGYRVVLSTDYSGAKATDRFESKQAAEDAAASLQLKSGKAYNVINSGSDYILEEKKIVV